ncbi:MAG: hypothetical protein V4713_03860 [Pseudomonadota bacterium]
MNTDQTNTQILRPLPAGTVVDFCGERGTVIKDDGGEKIEVESDGFRMNWYWVFEGISCAVVH